MHRRDALVGPVGVAIIAARIALVGQAPGQRCHYSGGTDECVAPVHARSTVAPAKCFQETETRVSPGRTAAPDERRHVGPLPRGVVHESRLPALGDARDAESGETGLVYHATRQRTDVAPLVRRCCTTW